MTELKCIWHKAGFHEAIDDKLKVSKDGKWVYWTMYGWNISGEDAHDIGCEWAYLDDLLACEKELIDIKKKLDYAITILERIAISPETMLEPEKIIPQLAALALEQINQKEEK